jgi:DNA-binding MarR family transcriptional regulator
LATALRVGVMRLARRLRRERDQTGLTPNQRAVLTTLERCGPRTLGQLATVEQITPPSMTRIANSLEEAGLVTRTVNDTDARQIVIALTTAAEQLLADAHRSEDEWLATRIDRLTPVERSALREAVSLMERVVAS